MAPTEGGKYNLQFTIYNCGRPIYTTPFVPYGGIYAFVPFG